MTFDTWLSDLTRSIQKQREPKCPVCQGAKIVFDPYRKRQRHCRNCTHWSVAGQFVHDKENPYGR